MENIQIFKNSQFGQVRIVVDEQGIPWFIAKDVSEILGYTDAQAMTRRLDDDDKKGIPTELLPKTDEIAVDRRSSIINESGLYDAIFGSIKPEAKIFKRWITHEVLPSIRKYGMYATEDFAEQALANPEHMIKVLQQVVVEREARKLAEKERELADLARQDAIEGELQALEGEAEAVRTKAHISRKREATAMGKASAAIKKVKILEDKLGDSTDWMTVVAALKRDGIDYNKLQSGTTTSIGLGLRKLSKEMGIEIRNTPNSIYGKVNIYHNTVFEEFKKRNDGLLIPLNRVDNELEYLGELY